MRAPAISLRQKLISLFAVGLLACGFLPFTSAFADDGGTQEVEPVQVNESSSVAPMLASEVVGAGTSVISADVMLDAFEPVIGSFTVNGLTFAVNDDGRVTLVSVAGPFMGPEGNGFAEGESSNIAIPSTVTYAGVEYPVTAIGPYAFYLSGATQVALPSSIASVDDRAFRSSDVERVEVDPANPNIASFDGALYSADLSRLLLIPEGRKGSVLLSCETEVITPSVFSHCSLVTSISVEEGGAAFSSWEGLLYNADGTTLLRVPAGATEITIREGCTTIAVGAMEGCAKLERISAPATVTFISPNVFESVPTVSLPASVILGDDIDESVILSDDAERSGASPFREASAASKVEGSPQQLTAMVVLSNTEAVIPSVIPSDIVVAVTESLASEVWSSVGFAVESAPIASLGEASTYAAGGPVYVKYNGTLNLTKGTTQSTRYSTVVRSITCTASGNGTPIGSFVWFSSGGSGICLYDGGSNYYGLTGGGLWYAASSAVFGSPIYDGIAYEIGSSGDTLTLTLTTNSPGYRYDLDANGGECAVSWIIGPRQGRATAPVPTLYGYKCVGWFTAPEGGAKIVDAGGSFTLNASGTLYAHWERVEYGIDFDTSSEPADDGYPGEDMEPVTIMGDEIVSGGVLEVANPKRPGYVFQGWVLPDASTGNKEVLDQDLVYQGDDGKWYVDVSSLPDFYDGLKGDDGKLHLTARWTSIISADVPSAVTFYADVVTQSNESREATVSGSFGQNKVANQSQVDLRVVGLESEAVETTDDTLGADSILKKAPSATPVTSAQKLLSLYPSAKAWTAEELQDPDAVGGEKAASAVDFDLDDLLLEASFSADDFTIPAGDTLNMGYRLNLTETGQELDYDKLATLEDGQSASIANVSYCFAADMRTPVRPSGTEETKETDPLWFELDEDLFTADGSQLIAQKGVYGLKDIKQAAEDMAFHASYLSTSGYYDLYNHAMDDDFTFHLRMIDGSMREMRVVGICQDTRSDTGQKAGLTFGSKNRFGAVTEFGSNTGTNWQSSYSNSLVKSALDAQFFPSVHPDVQAALVGVTKKQRNFASSAGTTYVTETLTDQKAFVPSYNEVFGADSLPSDGADFRYTYYAKGASYRIVDGLYWWTRSALIWSTAYGGNYNFYCVTSSGDVAGTYGARGYRYAIVPHFCL